MMFCQECGKVIPDGAKHCSFCGAPVQQSGPRHARPEQDDELYSYSDRHLSDEKDSTKIFDPERDELDETKVYQFENFEDRGQDYGDPYDNGFDPNNDPRFDPNYDPNEDPALIGDDYENYQDGLDDDTFMDRVDDRFRRDDYDDRRRPKKSKAWLWITLAVVAVVLLVSFAILAFSGSLFGNKNQTAPTASKATTSATAKPTQAPATQAPATKAPATQAPVTQAPATQAPVTQAPATEAVITEAPATQAVTQAPTNPPDQSQTEQSVSGTSETWVE